MHKGEKVGEFRNLGKENKKRRSGEERRKRRGRKRKVRRHTTSPAPQHSQLCWPGPGCSPTCHYSRIPPASCCHICQAEPWMPGRTAVPRRAQLQNEDPEVLGRTQRPRGDAPKGSAVRRQPHHCNHLPWASGSPSVSEKSGDDLAFSVPIPWGVHSQGPGPLRLVLEGVGTALPSWVLGLSCHFAVWSF